MNQRQAKAVTTQVLEVAVSRARAVLESNPKAVGMDREVQVYTADALMRTAGLTCLMVEASATD